MVTGLGMVSPLGSARTAFRKLISNQSGIISLSGKQHEESTFPFTIASNAKTAAFANHNEFFDLYAKLGYKGANDRLLSPFIQFALAATYEALVDANWIANLTESQKESTVYVSLNAGCLCREWDWIIRRRVFIISKFIIEETN